MSTTAALDGCRKLSILLLLSAPAFSGCETPQEPTDEPAPASPAHSAANDSRTLLLLRFNEKLTGFAGEQPTQASGLTFETGVLGSGVLVNGTDQLAYSTSGNIKAAAGTVEFWIKPRWNGNDHLDHWFFSIPGVLRVEKDAADNLRFILLGDDSEAGIAKNLGDWVANEWHFVAVTWTVPGAMKTYVDGVQVIAHASRAQDLITPMPAEMLVGSESGRLQARGVIDNLRISDVARSAEEIAASYAADMRTTGLTVQSITEQPFETWREPARVFAVTNVGLREYPASTAQWASSNPAVATVNANGMIRALKAGRATITARMGDVQGSLALQVKAPALPSKVEQIHPYLATPAANSLYQIPVVIFRYLPTADGVHLDPAFSPTEWNPSELIPLEVMRRRLDTADIRTKFMLEEGSKFRGYQNPGALPSLGYRVVAYITVYEPTPPGKVAYREAGQPVYQPDYYQILQRFNGRNYVENLGVKEFWLWQNHFTAGFGSYDPAVQEPVAFRNLDESNMSSPVTGDISNSMRDPSDMPIYSRTYVFYGQNIFRAGPETVHNRGHHLEATLSHRNWSLFWQSVVGTLGRAGCTERPPNTTVNYDYSYNYNPVASDIADWSSEEIGRKTPVSAHTWGDHPYPWPLGTTPTDEGVRNESHWYIYWMQSMPGRGNTIPYGVDGMENWWRFTADWDRSISIGLGLHIAATKPISVPSARDAVQTLRGQVRALVANGRMSAADGNTLQATLNSAAQFLDRKQMPPAAGAIGTFRTQLRAMVDGGRVNAVDVRTTLAGTRWLMNRMEVS